MGPELLRSRKKRETAELFDEELMSRLEYLEIVARKAFSGSARGERRAKKKGSGLEFADHRRYSPGDDFRNIDWNVYQRLGKLLIRLFEEEEDLYVYVLLDTSASMAVGDDTAKLDYARKVAAALAYITLAGLDRVSIVPFSAKIGQRLMPARGKAQIFRVFDFLAALEPGAETDMQAAFKAFVHQTRRHGVVVVISDLYCHDGYEAGLNLLRYHRFEPFVLHLTDERELSPRLRGDVVLVDCETGCEKLITLTPRVMARYLEAHGRWCRQVEDFCSEIHVPYFRTPIQVPFEELLLRVLRSGGFLA